MPKQPSKRPPRVFRNHDLEGLTDQLAANQVAAVHWLLFRKNLNPFHPKTARANLYNRAYLEVQRLLPNPPIAPLPAPAAVTRKHAYTRKLTP